MSLKSKLQSVKSNIDTIKEITGTDNLADVTAIIQEHADDFNPDQKYIDLMYNNIINGTVVEHDSGWTKIKLVNNLKIRVNPKIDVTISEEECTEMETLSDPFWASFDMESASGGGSGTFIGYGSIGFSDGRMGYINLNYTDKAGNPGGKYVTPYWNAMQTEHDGTITTQELLDEFAEQFNTIYNPCEYMYLMYADVDITDETVKNKIKTSLYYYVKKLGMTAEVVESN